MIRPRLLPLLLAPVLFAACSDETPSLPDAATTADAATTSDTATADGAAAEAGGDASAAEAGSDAAPAAAGLGLAVLHSDYKTTVVSLVDPATNMVTKDDCIDSGSKASMLTTVLSGDVVVPTQAQPGHDVLLIDRQNSTLTWVAPGTCGVTRQVNIGEGKMANPQDVIPVSAKKAYVTRYAADASDLAVIDPSTGMITGHVDLKPSAPAGVLPNPTRGLLLDGKAYVVLTALSMDSKTGGTGRVVVVDPATDTVTAMIDLPGLKNCASLTALDKALVVACGGVFGDPDQMLKDSGVALVDLSMTPPAVKVVAASAFGRALSPFDVAALSPSLAFAITSGAFDSMPPDQLWAFDFAGGAPRKVLDGKAGFSLSGLVADPAHNKLFLGDADPTAPKFRVLDLTNPTAITVQASLTTNAGGLPPRYASWY